MQTPWGQSDYSREAGPGVVFHKTPSHGGYKVQPAQNKLINAVWRTDDGWYEEDCAWAVVAFTFPKYFPPKALQQAIDTLKNCCPDQWEAVTGAVA